MLDKHMATVVEGNQTTSNGRYLRLDRYVEVKEEEYAAAGDQVWWLSLDDPNTANVDETSDLTLGFSTKRFDDQYWEAEDGESPFRYKFELERNPGIDPDEHPHFLAYKARERGEGSTTATELVWDSAEADTRDMFMEPGEMTDLQWVFTKPGTYEISVHLQGWVRNENNPPASPPAGWSPISENITETSEVKRYVIQVGSPLAENEPPVFGVNLTVPENSPADTWLASRSPSLKERRRRSITPSPAMATKTSRWSQK